jgi:hypothetical protein
MFLRGVSAAPTRELLATLLHLLLVVAVVELLTARVIGRVSFLYAGNPLLVALYKLGVFGVDVATLTAFATLLAVSTLLIYQPSLASRLYGPPLIALIPAALLAIPYALPLAALLAALTPLLVLRHAPDTGKLHLAALLSLVAAFLSASTNTLYGLSPLLRPLAEGFALVGAVLLFAAFRRSLQLAWWKLAVAIGLALLFLGAHYASGVAPWILRLVATFSLGFQLVLPIEAYTLALALYLLTIIGLPARWRLARYGLILLLLGGLPQWNIYPVYLSLLGLVLTTLSLTDLGAQPKPMGVEGGRY